MNGDYHKYSTKNIDSELPHLMSSGITAKAVLAGENGAAG
ncbi:hypothetical protein HMPREF0281_02000 [Corynebacterium ammoniagenes DSM 20306]|uniref:Uncharacterized protein n=1 Tax=Corynebacterium ammoniagenes DSM 20306 TaxID=649754 RepID=A0ABN0ACZ7_CORAM|nr:hypothetical protein HMPREF0281_02000 [Corynebacterium ammoniagenes DSM 20306]